MKLKPILLLWLLAAFTLGSCSQKGQTNQTAKAPAKQPNIVIFIGDDLGVTDIGPYGNKIVRTPNLDGLAKESMLFTRTYAGSPTCGPSRSSLLTGLLPFRHGAHGNHSGVKENTKSLIHYLQPLGYRVVLAGKLHFGPEEVFPFERISKTNVAEPGHEQKPGLNWDLNLGPVDQWLSQQKENDKPFVLIVADHSPHVIWPEKSSYNPQQVDIPEFHIDTKDTRTSRARYYEDITKMDGNVGKLLQSLNQHNLADNTLFVFTADQGPQWPFAKWSLYDYGIRTPMLIKWPGQVKPGSTNALVSQVDLLPTFVEIAGGQAPTEIDGKSFLPLLKGKKNTHHDVVFASHTGDRLMNRSPSRMLRNNRYKYILNLAPEEVYHTHMDKAKDHDGGREYWDSWVAKAKTDAHAAAVLQRYHHHPKEELYDLEADPTEMKNLAADPEYAQMLAGFRTQMAAWRKSQGDFETGPEQIKDEPQPKGQKPVAPYVFLD
ncbi:MAG: sulfatase [Rufibacter sp.]